jgi:hypothetical protein
VASQAAGAISHRGLERQSDVTTGEITNAIVAAGTVVRGFVEPVARELPMEYALELNRLIG